MPFLNAIIFILAEEQALSFSTVWSAFTSAFGTIVPFFSTHQIFMTLIALPIGVFAIGSVIKAIR